jgi:hypothetical protein
VPPPPSALPLLYLLIDLHSHSSQALLLWVVPVN